MFIPYISEPTRKLFIRKGGGGGGGHGGGGRGGSSRGGGGSVKSSTGAVAKGSANFAGAGRTSIPLTSGGQSIKATPFGNGGGSKTTIPPQQPFSGREVGGGTRSQVYGTSTYGSGYPGISGRGVTGRGFPYAFYPVVFIPPIAVGAPYLYNSEYGKPDNTSRPGGPLQEISIASNISTFHIISDNATVYYLHSILPTSCSGTTTFQVTLPQSYNSSQISGVQPEQAIQYYRASSAVLTLDGYNNTAAFGSDESAPPTPLPRNIDTNLMTCINQTIGGSIPLVGGGIRTSGPSSALIFLVFWVIWFCNTL
ncbi:hypothetical protein BDZ94DRAFT_1310362 [Collybia nuda]|uniref:Uncharacterized protein n=1 Tax=Collybia nuda TaxID=64659 RepID=A0A9P5Y1T6_9AGAR|nr:hypothetical protein BDZ94DRAFT_1310362 [Collybia nuda]